MTNRPARHHATTAAAVSAALLTLLTGCNSERSQAAAPVVTTATPSPTQPTATPTATETPATPQEKAIIAAEQAVRDYYAVMDRLGSNPAANPAQLRTVAVSTGLIDANNEVAFRRSKKQRQIGRTAVVYMRPTKVDLAFRPNKRPAPDIPVVELNICYDVSGVNVVDSSGRSVVTAARKDKALAHMGVTNYDWPNPHGWKIGYMTVKGDACPASS
jgi:hypothetical protein